MERGAAPSSPVSRRSPQGRAQRGDVMGLRMLAMNVCALSRQGGRGREQRRDHCLDGERGEGKGNIHVGMERGREDL